MKKKLFIISSEKISSPNGKDFYCDNIDMQSTPEKLNKYFDVHVISKKTKKVKSKQIKINSINVSENIFKYLIQIIKTRNETNSKYLIVSISPYTFLASLVLWIFKKKPYVYLRSNGFEEYKVLLGITGYFVYLIMFSIISKISILIACRKHILNGKNGYTVKPSLLDEQWIANISSSEVFKNNFLYVGRIRKEKGIFSLIKILEGQRDVNLTIVGRENDQEIKVKSQNINIKEIVNDKKKLIELYDRHSIFILPSFTEGHPMVLLEALARRRPVIIFNEIKHVIGDFKGIFIADRNISSLIEKINYVKNNYNVIQQEMNDNKLPSNNEFIKSMTNIIDN